MLKLKSWFRNMGRERDPFDELAELLETLLTRQKLNFIYQKERLEDMSQEFDALTAQVASLQTVAGEVAGNLASVEANVNTLEGQVTTLTSQLAALTAEKIDPALIVATTQDIANVVAELQATVGSTQANVATVVANTIAAVAATPAPDPAPAPAPTDPTAAPAA